MLVLSFMNIIAQSITVNNAYDAFYDFPGNPIMHWSNRYTRYRVQGLMRRQWPLEEDDKGV